MKYKLMEFVSGPNINLSTKRLIGKLPETIVDLLFIMNYTNNVFANILVSINLSLSSFAGHLKELC